MESTKLNILIIEDELLIAEMLKEILLELNYNVVAIAKNYSTAFEKIKQQPEINFAFIDINLNDEKNGLDIAQKINSEYKIPFMFLTSYSDSTTVQEAIAMKPQSYIIKPFSKSELFVSLEIFKSREIEIDSFIEIKDGHKNVKINHSDIYWIKSDNVYLEINTNQKLYVVRSSLDSFFEKLNKTNFIRVHRSYIVNLKHIKSINRQFAFVNNVNIPISRNNYDQLIEKFSE